MDKKLEELMEGLSEEYTEKEFKTNPDGFHVAPWANSDVLLMAFEAGFEACYKATNNDTDGINMTDDELNDIEQAITLTLDNMGTPQDGYMTGYGQVLKDGNLTEAGIKWAIDYLQHKLLR